MFEIIFNASAILKYKPIFYNYHYHTFKDHPGSSDGKKNPPACCEGDLGLMPGLGKITWRREWQLTPVFVSGEFHGQRSLAGYSPWDYKELDTTE